MRELDLESKTTDLSVSAHNETANLWISGECACLDVDLDKSQAKQLRDWLNEFLGENQ